MVNLFLLGGEPEAAVKQYCDSHVVKMTSECAQILCTVLHHWGLWESTNAKFPLWKPAYVKHPVVFWAQASVNSALLLCRYGQCLLDEYAQRYGKQHEALKPIATASAIIANCFERWHALPTGHLAKQRPTFLDKTDLVAAARTKYDDKYADALAPKLYPFSACANRESFEAGYYHACVCAFALSVPGVSKATNDALTRDLYALGASIEEQIRADPDASSMVTSHAGTMHGLYYACKVYIGFGVKRSPPAWWGETGSVPEVVASFLPEVCQHVFLPYGILPANLGVPRRLPTTKCLAFDASNGNTRVSMVSPTIVADDITDASNSEDDVDVENAAPNPRKRPRRGTHA